jgi:hypothetical protein
LLARPIKEIFNHLWRKLSPKVSGGTTFLCGLEDLTSVKELETFLKLCEKRLELELL